MSGVQLQTVAGVGSTLVAAGNLRHTIQRGSAIDEALIFPIPFDQYAFEDARGNDPSSHQNPPARTGIEPMPATQRIPVFAPFILCAGKCFSTG